MIKTTNKIFKSRVLLLCLFWISSSLFATPQQPISKEDGVVILNQQEVYNGDFFAMGRSIEIAGTVNGDVYVMGGQVIIDGIINGDLIAVGGSIDLSGSVNQSCRLVGGQALISGQIKKNISVLSGNLQLLESATIGKDLVAASGIIDSAADIGATASVISSNMRVSSHIHQNLQGYIGKLRIASKARIDGDVDYRSDSPALIDPGAVISGQILYQPSLVHRILDSAWVHKLFAGSQMLILFMNFIYTFIVGVFLVKLFPHNLTITLHALSHQPLKSLACGSLIIIFLPFVFLLLLITILGVPFALTLMAINIMGFYTAKVYSILWVSHWAGKKLKLPGHSLWLFLLTILVYFGLATIPIFGSLLAFVAFLFGLGAGVIAQMRPKTVHL